MKLVSYEYVGLWLVKLYKLDDEGHEVRLHKINHDSNKAIFIHNSGTGDPNHDYSLVVETVKSMEESMSSRATAG